VESPSPQSPAANFTTTLVSNSINEIDHPPRHDVNYKWIVPNMHKFRESEAKIDYGNSIDTCGLFNRDPSAVRLFFNFARLWLRKAR